MILFTQNIYFTFIIESNSIGWNKTVGKRYGYYKRHFLIAHALVFGKCDCRSKESQELSASALLSAGNSLSGEDESHFVILTYLVRYRTHEKEPTSTNFHFSSKTCTGVQNIQTQTPMNLFIHFHEFIDKEILIFLSYIFSSMSTWSLEFSLHHLPLMVQ